MRRRVLLLILTGAPLAAAQLPLKPNSVRFAVIGDSGTGERVQYELAQQMAKYREKVQFDFVLMLGDNIYGGDTPLDFKWKFEDPYRALTDAKVKFFASLGNHDNPNQRFYKPFNMGGQRYYSFKNGKAEFFALDSNYMDPTQLDWIKNRLEKSTATWKICFFHHPLYSDARFHGSDKDLRARLMPFFEKYGVNVVLAGHDHVYERFKPRNGIVHFVAGASGKLRYQNIRRASPDMAKGFDTDLTFMLIEIVDNQLYFQTISRTGETVDSGVIAATR